MKRYIQVLVFLLAAFMILAISGCDYNFINLPHYTTAPQGTTQQVGNKVGNKLPGKALPIITGDTPVADGQLVTEESFDPTTTGKITVINFWGTWNASCVEGLANLNQFAEDYAGSVVVVAVHTDLLKDTAPAYIKEHYPNSKMIFLLDNATSDYFNALGGLGAYPHTVVIDENGIVIANNAGPMHYDDLVNIIVPALMD